MTLTFGLVLWLQHRFIQTKPLHISQKVTICLSLCLLGAALVGESCMPWIPLAADCKLKISPWRDSWDVFYIILGSYGIKFISLGAAQLLGAPAASYEYRNTYTAVTVAVRNTFYEIYFKNNCFNSLLKVKVIVK